MPTLHVDLVHLRDGGVTLRCPQHPGWRGPKKDRTDRDAVEKHLRAHQTRHTTIEWYETPATGDLEHLGFS